MSKHEWLTGHISLGKLTIYGRNAMHWGVTFHTKKYGFICFRLPFTYLGKWLPLYLYFSPNATPGAATFMLGKKAYPRDWALARLRYLRLGHNFTYDSVKKDNNYKIMYSINNYVHTCHSYVMDPDEYKRGKYE